jgi:hypothetical protein
MKSLNSVLFIVTVSILVSGICFGYEDEGFQWWSKAGTSFDVAKDWKCAFEQEFRLGDDGGNFYYEHSDLAFTYSGLAEWLDVGAGFRLIYEKDSSDDFQRENMPYIIVTLKGRLFDFPVSTRSRIEYRDRTAKEDVWRYRNKITVKLPVELTPLKLKPYLADEIFITLNDDNVDKNRLYFGAVMPLSQSVEAEIFYMWQTSRVDSGDWSDIQVLGTTLKFKF